MAGFNLLGAGAGAAGGLEVLLARLRAEEDQKRERDALNQRGNLGQQQIDQNLRIAQMTNDRQREINQTNAGIRQDQQASLTSDREMNRANQTASLLSKGDEVDPETAAAMTKANPMLKPLLPTIPGAQVTQTQGIANLPQSAPSGVSTLKMSAPVTPAGVSETTTDKTSPLNAPSTIRFKGTAQGNLAEEKQTDVRAKNDDANQRQIDKIEAAAKAAEAAGNLTQAKILYTQAETLLANARAANVGQAKPGGTAEKKFKVEYKDPTTGKTVIEYIPESQLEGRKFEKGVGSALEARLASASAVTQVGNDIIAAVSDPKTQATLGPLLGRAGTLRDWIGNPPPEFADLAGEIESYSLANMGVHGMRSAQGAQLISKLLDQHHTPESLAAAVRGLQNFSKHFMENEGRPVPQAGQSDQSAPAKPKRVYNPATGKLE